MGMLACFGLVVCSSPKKVICSLLAVCPYTMVNAPILYVLTRRGRAEFFLLYPCSVVTSCYTIDRWEVCATTTTLFCRGSVSFGHYVCSTTLLSGHVPWVPRRPETVGARFLAVPEAWIHPYPAR